MADEGTDMMPETPPRPVDILLVEDNPGDARLAREALREAGLWHRLTLATDGEAALACLRREGAHAAGPRPDLVLLDLHLPRRDGWEVLRAMGADARLRDLPVAVLAGVPEEYSDHSDGHPPVVGVCGKPPAPDRILALVREAVPVRLLAATVPGGGGKTGTWASGPPNTASPEVGTHTPRPGEVERAAPRD